MMRNWLDELLDNIVWVFLILLLIPSGFAVASWNSLPGTMLYGVKVGMERALLTVTPTQEAKGELQVAFTERRFSEAKQLLTNQASGRGLTYLDAQIRETKETIQKAPNREAQKKLAKKYIATLRNVHTQLEQQRQVITSAQPPAQQQVVVVNQYTTYQIVVTNPTNPPPFAAATATRTPIPTPTVGENPPPPDDPVGDIDDTQGEIDDAIDELEELANAASFGAPSPDELQQPLPTETSGPVDDGNKWNSGKSEKEITEPTKKESWNDHGDEN